MISEFSQSNAEMGHKQLRSSRDCKRRNVVIDLMAW